MSRCTSSPLLGPIASHIEMGQNLGAISETLTRDATYPGLFERAFGDRQITGQRIGDALAQFVRALVSYQSRYDDGRAGVKSVHDDLSRSRL